MLKTLMTEIRDPRSVRQSQIRFRPEKASKCAKDTNDRDPRSEIRDPCDSHRSDLDQKRRQNVLRTLMTEIRDPRSEIRATVTDQI